MCHLFLFIISFAKEETAPTSVKLFVNLPNPGFGDVEDLAPVQTVELTSENLTRSTPVNLKTVKFQRVNRYHHPLLPSFFQSRCFSL